eukprot:1158443-Pelagomonas_calceolata.AAC.29
MPVTQPESSQIPDLKTWRKGALNKASYNHALLASSPIYSTSNLSINKVSNAAGSPVQACVKANTHTYTSCRRTTARKGIAHSCRSPSTGSHRGRAFTCAVHEGPEHRVSLTEGGPSRALCMRVLSTRSHRGRAFTCAVHEDLTGRSTMFGHDHRTMSKTYTCSLSSMTTRQHDNKTTCQFPLDPPRFPNFLWPQ